MSIPPLFSAIGRRASVIFGPTTETSSSEAMKKYIEQDGLPRLNFLTMQSGQTLEDIKGWAKRDTRRSLEYGQLGLEWDEADSSTLRVVIPALQGCHPHENTQYFRLPRSSVDQVFEPLMKEILAFDPWSESRRTRDSYLESLPDKLLRSSTQILSEHVEVRAYPPKTPAQVEPEEAIHAIHRWEQRPQIDLTRIAAEWVDMDNLLVTMTDANETEPKCTAVISSTVPFSCRAVTEEDIAFWEEFQARISQEREERLTERPLWA